MAWSGKQKSIAAMACKAAGLTDQQRTDVILRNFPNASYNGDITSTSPKLTNIDFEQFMAVVEGYAGGQVLKYAKGHWQAAAVDRWQRMRHHCEQLDSSLQAADVFTAESLGQWIAKRVASGRCTRLEELDYHGLSALILQLESYCRQRGVAVA